MSEQRADSFFSSFKIKDFYFSLILHGAMIGGIGYYSYKKDFVKTELKLIKYKKSFIQTAVKVDIVAMPKLTVQELKKIKKNKSFILASKGQVKANSIKRKQKKLTVKSDNSASQDSFNKLISQLSSEKIDLKKIKKKKAYEKDDDLIDSKQQEQLKKLVFEGNKLSKGSLLFSDKVQTEEQRENVQGYAEKIIMSIRTYWSLPSYLLDKKLSCQVRVYISENGELLKAFLHKSSEEKEFDQRALRAIEQAAPFVKPQKDIVESLVAGEILLGFPL